MSVFKIFCLAIIQFISFSAIAGLPQGTIDESTMEAPPIGKKPLIKRTYRPPNYETPEDYLGQPFTSNDRFFVRYHLAVIPEVKVAEWKLKVEGALLEKPLTLTLNDLKKNYKPVEIAALAYCSGNRRGLFEPHVPGVEWAYGAMGNARWKGVRLRDILEKAGLKKGAVEIVFDGADGPVYEKTPDFQKSLPLSKALDENTIIAYEMNGKPLPHFQGFPVRLVVPGWTATYWVKHLISIRPIEKPFDGFWMKKAYRIPKGKFPGETFDSQSDETSTPITQLVVNSLITNLHDNQEFKAGQTVKVRGLGWDGGHGIKKVEISRDGGASWESAKLGKDHGRFSWRDFSYDFKPEKSGEFEIMAKATNEAGETQRTDLIFNPAGYHHNLIQKIKVKVIAADEAAAAKGKANANTNAKVDAHAGSEKPFELKAAPGRDKVAANCTLCHSLDYIPMNSPFLDKKGWETEVNKMIKVMGAPIKTEDVPAIVEYLTLNYGKN